MSYKGSSCTAIKHLYECLKHLDLKPKGTHPFFIKL